MFEKWLYGKHPKLAHTLWRFQVRCIYPVRDLFWRPIWIVTIAYYERDHMSEPKAESLLFSTLKKAKAQVEASLKTQLQWDDFADPDDNKICSSRCIVETPFYMRIEIDKRDVSDLDWDFVPVIDW